MDAPALPPRLEEIVADFELCEGREKLELLLEFARRLPPLPERWAAQTREMESVPECMTPVSVAAELENGGMRFFFAVPEESPTVRGFASILEEGLRGAPPEQVVALPLDFSRRSGLHEVLTSQRLNGLHAMTAHVRRLAAGLLDPAA